MDKKNIDILLKKAYPSIAGRIDSTKIRKIIPVAFPVLQSTWKIKVIIDEPAGLIDRYILRVLKNFGPCNVDRIDELLCLGQERILHALAEMERLGSPITRTGNQFAFSKDGDIEHFRIEREHEFSFCINGISGDLLPIDFCHKAKDAEINDFQDEYPLFVKFSPIINGLESQIKTLQAGKDAGNLRVGVPDGFVCLTEKNPSREYCRYFLAFLVSTDESVSLFSVGNEIVSLDVKSDYLRSIPEIANVLNKTDSYEIPLAGISVKQNGASILVDVLDKELWSCFDIEESSTLSVFFMMDFIKNGWLWDLSQRKFSHYILRPANEETTKALFISRASYELGHKCSSIDSRQNAEKWLGEYFHAFNYKNFSCPALDEVLYPLQKSLSSEIKDFLRLMSNAQPKKKIQHKINKCFYSSMDDDWENIIIDWLKKAQSSIQIISPVVESESVFKALNDANKRGVDLQVITSFLDRDGKIKDDGDKQFSAFKLPRQKLAFLGASVRATQNIPHAKMIIIDKSVVLFTSANLYDNSLGKGKNNAIETCVALQEETIVRQSEKLFDEIWASAQFTQGIDRSSVFVSQNSGKKLKDINNFFEGKVENIIFSHPGNEMLKNRIIQMLEVAKHDVVLMAMSFYDLEETGDLFSAILSLLKRNIAVTVLVRPGVDQFGESMWPDCSTKKLLSAGMRLKEIPHLHAKGVIVDNSNMMLMSANFNPYSLGNLTTSHIEFGLEAKENASWRSGFKAFAKTLLKQK